MARKAAESKKKTSHSETLVATSEQSEAASRLGVNSKTDAVKAAIQAGFALPQAGTAYIRDTFGVDMTTQHFSAVKTLLRKRDKAPKGKRGRKPKSVGYSVEGYLAPPSRRSTTTGADLLNSLESLKPLVAEYGADNVKRLVDLLG